MERDKDVECGDSTSKYSEEAWRRITCFFESGYTFILDTNRLRWIYCIIIHIVPQINALFFLFICFPIDGMEYITNTMEMVTGIFEEDVGLYSGPRILNGCTSWNGDQF